MKTIRIIFALVLVASAAPATAGLYTDDMSRCLVASTTPADKETLVRWMFAAMAQHPAVASLASVKSDDVEKANAAVGALFMKLLTESCVDKTKAAVKYEGPAAIQLAFQVLGQAAAGDIFSHPEVTKVISGLEKYVDTKKLEALK